jgi:hypothetical protein
LAGSSARPSFLRFERPNRNPGFDPFPLRVLGYDGFCLSRPFLEFVTRGGVEQKTHCPIPTIPRWEVMASTDRTAVTGIRYEDAGGRIAVLPVDLVIDASGRGALTMALLDSIGAVRPQETEIGIELLHGNRCRHGRRPISLERSLASGPPSHHRGGAIILPIENKQRMVTLGGVHGNVHPGTAMDLRPSPNVFARRPSTTRLKLQSK